MRLRRCASLALSASLLASAPASAQLFGPQGPKAIPFEGVGAAEAPGFTTTVDLAGLKGVKRVVVPQFTVEFVELSQGLSAKKRDRVKIDYEIAVPETAARQALVEKLYARFVQGLQSQGLTVAPLAEAMATRSGAKLLAIGKPAPELLKTDMGRNRIFTANATPYWFYPADLHLGGNSMTWGFAGAQMAEHALAEETGAGVMTVRFVVGLRETHKASRFAASLRTADSMVGRPAIVVEGLGSEVAVQVPGRRGYDMIKRPGVKVKDDLLFREDLLDGRTKVANGATGTVSNVAARGLFLAGVASTAMGMGGTGMSLFQDHKVACTPEPAAYLAAVDRNLSAVEDMFLAQLAPAW